jgi:large subunit ribosomal protein L21
MSSSHGTQLQLALEEGRGKDDAPFDPFSQFLDAMGSTNDLDDDEYDDEGDEEDIEEAEYSYKTTENYDDENKNTTTGLQINDDDDVDESEDEKNFIGVNSRRSTSISNPTYTTTGALYRPKSERLALRAGYPAGGNFAVIFLAGFQHKVAVDDLLVVNKLKPISAWSVGSTHTIKDSDILLLANQDKTLVGLPGVAGGEVEVMVEEITRDKTLIIFKKRRRKNSRRKNGFRRQVTFLRVLDVRMPGEVQADGSSRSSMMEDDVKVAA